MRNENEKNIFFFGKLSFPISGKSFPKVETSVPLSRSLFPDYQMILFRLSDCEVSNKFRKVFRFLEIW